MKIEGRTIGNDVFVIAEIGLNHNGDFDSAKKLISYAAESNADAVTIQLIEPYSLSNDPNVIDFLKKVLFSNEQIKELVAVAKAGNIVFGAAVLDVISLNRAIECGASFIKTVSGEITNYQLLREIGKANIPYFVSTGASSLEEVELAVKEVNNIEQIALIHTTTQQQSPLASLNLRAIQLLKDKFGVPIGYCDHTNEEFAIPVAVAAGATIIEKYIIEDRSLNIADYKVSAEPSEFKALVNTIRTVENALGNSVKVRNEYENEHILKIRRSAVAKTEIMKGELLVLDRIEFKRPGGGLSYSDLQSLLDRPVVEGFKQGEIITKDKVA